MYRTMVTSAWRGEEDGPRTERGTPDYDECERMTVAHYIRMAAEHPEWYQRDQWVIEADGFPRRRTEDEKPLDQQIVEERSRWRRDLNIRGGPAIGQPRERE